MTVNKSEKYMAEGNKILERKTFFGFGKTKNYEDAIEVFTKAGYAFKIENDLESAGNAFLKVAKIIKQEKSEFFEYSYTKILIEAGNCFKKINPEKTIKIFNRVIEINNEEGNFYKSGRYYQEIGEIYETIDNPIEAMNSYQQAVKLFIADNKLQEKTKCLLNIAKIESSLDEFSKAAEIFESIAYEYVSMNNRLIAYSVRGYILQCCLCYFSIGDCVSARSKLENFKNMDNTFASCRECSFIENICIAFDGFNIDHFHNTCEEFDRITPFDSWKTNILLKAKKHIELIIEIEDEINLS